MNARELKTHISHAERGNAASLRRVLDNFATRLEALESHDDSTDAGGKSERGKIKAAVTRLDTRVKALEGGA